MDENGYVMGAMSFLLIIPIITLSLVFINLNHDYWGHKDTSMGSDTSLIVFRDIKNNIPIITLEVIRDKSYQVINSKKPLTNSKNAIKDDINDRMDILSGNYQNQGIKTNITIYSVKETSDPFIIQVKTHISVNKGLITHEETITQNISLVESNPPLPDPMPFLICNPYGEVKINQNRIEYGSSIVNLLASKNVSHREIYENATSPLYIKKCPYDPFSFHGNRPELIILKNCIENGYFHNSNDAACYFCRLEGKSQCPHQGMEMFVIPPASNYSQPNRAPCSVDHVLFAETKNDIYSGYKLTYYSYENLNYYLYLDNAHRSKYGLPLGI